MEDGNELYSQKDGYLHLRHSKTLLMAHIIFVTKYRKSITERKIWEAIKQDIYDTCTKMHIHVIQMEQDKDYIHMLIRYDPKESITTIISRLKQVTTYRAWKRYAGYFKKVYWKEHTLWSDGYFACSIGNASRATIENYIKNQG